VAGTGLSPQNAFRLQRDGACAFLDKAELGLEPGSQVVLLALARIVADMETGGSELAFDSGR